MPVKLRWSRLTCTPWSSWLRVADHLKPETKQLPGYKNQLKLIWRCFSNRNLTLIYHFLYTEMHLLYFNCSKHIFKRPKFIVSLLLMTLKVKVDHCQTGITLNMIWIHSHLGELSAVASQIPEGSVIHNKFTKNLFHFWILTHSIKKRVISKTSANVM